MQVDPESFTFSALPLEGRGIRKRRPCIRSPRKALERSVPGPRGSKEEALCLAQPVYHWALSIGRQRLQRTLIHCCSLAPVV